MAFAKNRLARRAGTTKLQGIVIETLLDKAAGPEVAPSPAPEKGDLLARLLKRLAHEIRNPLSSLDVQFQLLEEDLAAAAAPLRPQTASMLSWPRLNSASTTLRFVLCPFF